MALVCANLCYVAHMFINKIKKTRRRERIDLMIVTLCDPVVIIINVQYTVVNKFCSLFGHRIGVYLAASKRCMLG